MQKINKKLILMIIAIIILLGGFLTIMILKKDKTSKYDYYYTFSYDDNLITQSVEVYNKKGEKQSNYYVFYNDSVVTLTKTDKAVLTIAKLDLKDEPVIEILFDGEKEKHKVSIKK